MDLTDIARWQFAITTVYHFLFVPITIGLSAVVAGYHTAWLRTGNTQHLRVAKFLGKLFTINFALGLVTGIVLSFAHTLGEFGVVLMVGGNLPGVTRTVSISIYDAVQSLDYAAASRTSRRPAGCVAAATAPGSSSRARTRR